MSNFNALKALTLLAHAGLFWSFYNPPHSDSDSDMDYRILQRWYGIVSYAYAQRGLRFINYSLIRRNFGESVHNLSPEKSQGGYKV